MQERDGEKSTLRRYLLGSVPEGERDRLEQALLADENLYEELLATEEELIDQYVWGQLTEPEQASFLQYLSALPGHEQRLDFAQALRAHGLNSRAETSVPSGGAQSKPGVASRCGSRLPAFLRVAAVFLMVLGGVWSLTTIWELRREAGRNLSELARSTDSQEEADRTASVPSRSFLLTSGTLRGGGKTQVLRMPQKPALVEFRLDLGLAEHEVYRVVLHDAQSAELMSLGQLRARIQEDEVIVAFSISSERFTPGDYYISLGGVTENGEFEPVARYDFRISSE